MEREAFDTDVTDFAQALGLLVRRIRAAGAGQDVSWPQAIVLSRLCREGPATVADLARAEGMKPQSMSTTIAALEEMGMIARKPHPTDGRQMTIELTPKGAEISSSTREAKLTWLAHAITQLDDQERATLFAAGEIMRRLVES
jgi:DNA-binding MarR family transcriptional regulator